MKTLAESWADFASRVLPRCSEVQRQEMRRAFYAGAHTLLMDVFELGDADDAEAIAQLEAKRNEIDVFYLRLGQGKPGY